MELTIEALLSLIIGLIEETIMECKLVSPYGQLVDVHIILEFTPDSLSVYVHDDPELESLLFSLRIRNDFGVESELPEECFNDGYAKDCLWYLTKQLLGRQSHNCTSPLQLWHPTDPNELSTPTSELPTAASELQIMTSKGLAEEIFRLCQDPRVSKIMQGNYRLNSSQLVVLELMCGVRVPCAVVISTNSASEIEVELYWQTSDGLVSFFSLTVTIDVQNGRLTLHIDDLAYTNSKELKGLLPKGIARFLLLLTQELGYALACWQPIESIFITVCSAWHAPDDINFRDYELFRDTGKTFYTPWGFIPKRKRESWDHSTKAESVPIDTWLLAMKAGDYQPAWYSMQLPLNDQQAERFCYDASSTIYTIELVDKPTCIKNIENGHLKVGQSSIEGVSVKRQRLS